MGLRIYTVHVPPPSADDSTPILIKEGFSWPAFFLGIFWTLWHRLWIESAALLALFLALGVILDYVDFNDLMESAILLAVAVLIGASAADWRRQSLQRRGYRDAGVVSGPDIDSALRRFLDLQSLDLQPATAAAMPPSAPPGPPVAPTPGSAAAGSIAGWYASAFQQPAIGERRTTDDSGGNHSWNAGPSDPRPPGA